MSKTDPKDPAPTYKTNLWTNARSEQQAPTDMAAIVAAIKNPGRDHRHRIARLRAAKDEKARAAIKVGLPSFPIQCHFPPEATSHSEKNIGGMNGLCGFDIDHLPDAEAVRTEIVAKLGGHVLWVAVSPSGNGVKGCVVVPEDWRGLDHRSVAFPRLNQWLLNQLHDKSLSYDPSGADPSRMCFLPADESAFYNPRATPPTLVEKDWEGDSADGPLPLPLLERAVEFDGYDTSTLAGAYCAGATHAEVAKYMPEGEWVGTGSWRRAGGSSPKNATFNAENDNKLVVFSTGCPGLPKGIYNPFELRTRAALFEKGISKRKREAIVEKELEREGYSPEEPEAEEREAYYLNPAKHYIYWSDKSETFVTCGQRMMESTLARDGYPKVKPKGVNVTTAEDRALDICQNHNIEAVMELSGRGRGLHRIGPTKQILCPEGMRVIPASSVPGPSPIIHKLARGLAERAYPPPDNPQDGEALDRSALAWKVTNQEQQDYLYSWLKQAVHQLESGQHDRIPMLILAGEAGCGKTFFQTVVTNLLGGRSMSMSSAVEGSFNSQLFGVEHIFLDDRDERGRVTASHVAGLCKNYIANKGVECHGKFQRSFMLEPCWALTMSVNTTTKALKVLPTIGEDNADKVSIIRCGLADFAGDGLTDHERMDLVLAEIPYFKHWLGEEFETPEAMKSPRFHLIGYHNADFQRDNLLKSREWTTVSTCRDMVDQMGFDGGGDWVRMGLGKLYKELRVHLAGVDMRDQVENQTMLAEHLELVESQAKGKDRVVYREKGMAKRWCIKRHDKRLP